jgi:DNA-binding transcriptional MerR regulator
MTGVALVPRVSADLSIGTLAEQTGRSIHTLRWYETQGLMPGVRRSTGGRRIYSSRHIDWIELLGRLQHTGMSIAEMRRYALLVTKGKATLAERKSLLAAHRKNVIETIRDWQNSLSLLEWKIDFYDAWLTSGQRPATAETVIMKTPTTRGRAAIDAPSKRR